MTLERWSDRPAGGTGPEHRAAELARAARAAPLPSPEALAALEAKVAAGPPPRAWGKPAAVASVSVAVIVAWLLLRPGGGAYVPPPILLPLPPPPAQPVALVEPPPAPAPAPELPPAPAPVAPPSRPSRPVALAPAVKPAPAPTVAPIAAEPEESSLLVETRMLRAALEELRQRRDGAAAMKALDAYFARFPAGALRSEAQVARVDALQLLGRRDEALGLLDELDRADFAGLPRRLELKVLRGELLSAKERCGEAVGAFASALGGGLPAPLEERALIGRAGCHGRLGEPAKSRADLERYLDRYPEGRFAKMAREALGE